MWFQTGVIPPAGTYDKYWADPYTLFFIEVIAFQFAELRRWQDYRKPGSMGKQYFLGLEEVLKGSGDPAYPGTPHCYSLKSLKPAPSNAAIRRLRHDGLLQAASSSTCLDWERAT